MLCWIGAQETTFTLISHVSGYSKVPKWNRSLSPNFKRDVHTAWYTWALTQVQAQVPLLSTQISLTRVSKYSGPRFSDSTRRVGSEPESHCDWGPSPVILQSGCSSSHRPKSEGLPSAVWMHRMAERPRCGNCKSRFTMHCGSSSTGLKTLSPQARVP